MQRSRNIQRIAKLLVTLFILIIFLFPLYWLFISSLKSNVEIFANQKRGFVHIVCDSGVDYDSQSMFGCHGNILR